MTSGFIFLGNSGPDNSSCKHPIWRVFAYSMCAYSCVLLPAFFVFGLGIQGVWSWLLDKVLIAVIVVGGAFVYYIIKDEHKRKTPPVTKTKTPTSDLYTPRLIK